VTETPLPSAEKKKSRIPVNMLRIINKFRGLLEGNKLFKKPIIIVDAQNTSNLHLNNNFY
jgi:hypothetical protein